MGHLFGLILRKKKAVSKRKPAVSMHRLSPGSPCLHHLPQAYFPRCTGNDQIHKPLFIHSLRHKHSERVEMVWRVVSFQINTLPITKFNQSSPEWKTPNYHNSKSGWNKKYSKYVSLLLHFKTHEFFFYLSKLKLWISCGAHYKTEQFASIYIVFYWFKREDT